jgi:hypothetical protein
MAGMGKTVAAAHADWTTHPNNPARTTEPA